MEAERELTVSSLLAAALSRCAAICEQTLEAYVAADPGLAGSPFGRALMAAVAALQTAAEAEERDWVRRETTLAVAAVLAEDAAVLLRGHGLDERLLRCAAACERAACLCENALERR